MAFLVEYKCEQTNPSIYQFEHKYIKQIMNMNNKSMQGINTMRDRERAIANTGDLFRGSGTLALRPRLQHYEGFSL